MKPLLTALSLLIATYAFAGASNKMSTPTKQPKMHTVTIGDFTKDYPFVGSDHTTFTFPYLNFRDDAALIDACVDALAGQMPENVDVIVILGDKANTMGTRIATKIGLPWTTMIGKKTPLGSIASVDYATTTSGKKSMHLSPENVAATKGKRVVILDDVMTTGSTARAAIKLLKGAGADVIAIMCAFTEETDRHDFEGLKLIKLGHLPIIEGANCCSH